LPINVLDGTYQVGYFHSVHGLNGTYLLSSSATSPQSNELIRGPPELVKHFRLHRRKSATCPKFDMVWLYRSPVSVRRRGVISSFKWGGEGGRHPVYLPHFLPVHFLSRKHQARPFFHTVKDTQISCWSKRFLLLW
jgi:hypothetical protein